MPARADRRLSLGAFVTGFATLGLEVTAARLLAPSFGASLLVWSNVIGVLLAALAAGYVLGGRLADRRAPAPTAGGTLLLAGLFVAGLPLFSGPLLRLARNALENAAVSTFLGSLAAMALLVAPAAFLLGMVPPLLLKLATRDLGELGRASGSLFAISTVGSILGTFVPALVTIPFLGTFATLHLLGGALVVSALPFLGWRAAAALLVPLVLLAFPIRRDRAARLLEERETLYQYVAVEETEDGTRILRMNEGLAAHSTWVPGERLSGTMYDAFLLADALKDGGVGTLLDVGLAGGTIAHVYQTHLPHVRVTGVELDPAVVELGRRFFTLDEPNLEIAVRDGRLFLATTDRRFDAVAVDVFRQPHVPFPFTTREFFGLVKERLSPGGAMLMNVAAMGRDDPLLAGLLNTAASVFSEVDVYRAVGHRNFLMLASDTPGLRERLARNPVPEDVEGWRAAMRDDMERVPFDPSREVFTDDRSPAELYADLLFLRHLAARP